jgi:hypothetical protein
MRRGRQLQADAACSKYFAASTGPPGNRGRRGVDRLEQHTPRCLRAVLPRAPGCDELRLDIPPGRDPRAR